MGFLHALFGSSAKEEYAPVRVDASSAALISIGSGHHEAHEGAAFRALLADNSMIDGATSVIAFKTPAVPEIHMIMGFRTLVGGSMEVVEAPTWANQTGTLLAVTNRKRAIHPLPTTLLEDQGQASFVAGNIQANPTTLAGGTVIFLDYAWGEKGKIDAGRERDSEEFILRPSTQYAIRFTAIGGSNKAITILDWYEHSPSHVPA